MWMGDFLDNISVTVLEIIAFLRRCELKKGNSELVLSRELNQDPTGFQ